MEILQDVLNPLSDPQHILNCFLEMKDDDDKIFISFIIIIQQIPLTINHAHQYLQTKLSKNYCKELQPDVCSNFWKKFLSKKNQFEQLSIHESLLPNSLFKDLEDNTLLSIISTQDYMLLSKVIPLNISKISLLVPNRYLPEMIEIIFHTSISSVPEIISLLINSFQKYSTSEESLSRILSSPLCPQLDEEQIFNITLLFFKGILSSDFTLTKFFSSFTIYCSLHLFEIYNAVPISHEKYSYYFFLSLFNYFASQDNSIFIQKFINFTKEIISSHNLSQVIPNLYPFTLNLVDHQAIQEFSRQLIRLPLTKSTSILNVFMKHLSTIGIKDDLFQLLFLVNCFIFSNYDTSDTNDYILLILISPQLLIPRKLFFEINFVNKALSILSQGLNYKLPILNLFKRYSNYSYLARFLYQILNSEKFTSSESPIDAALALYLLQPFDRFSNYLTNQQYNSYRDKIEPLLNSTFFDNIDDVHFPVQLKEFFISHKHSFSYVLSLNKGFETSVSLEEADQMIMNI